MGGLDHRGDVPDGAAGAGILKKHAEQGAVAQAGAQAGARIIKRIALDDIEAERSCPGFNHRQGLRMAVIGDEEGIGVRFAKTVRHGHGLGRRGAFVQKRGVGDFHGGQVHHHLLEVHAGFQPALADLGLIGGIGGIPAGVFQHIAEDDAGHLGAVIAHADHRDENPVPFRHAPEVRQRPAFGLVGADVEGFVGEDAFGHHRFDQPVEGLQAEEFEHFGDLFFTGTDMAADEVVTLFQVAQGLSGH